MIPTPESNKARESCRRCGRPQGTAISPEGFPQLLGRAHAAHRLHRPGGGLFEKTINGPASRSREA